MGEELVSGFNQGNVHAGTAGFEEGYQWASGTTPNGATIFTTPNNGIIDAIIGRVEAVESGICTVTVVKCAAGVSVANGTALSSVALQAGTGGTALQPQLLIAQGAPASLSVRAGDTIGVQSTGSFSASSGNINIYWHAT